MPHFQFTESRLVMALDPSSLAMLKQLAERGGHKLQVLSATAMTAPALLAACDPCAVVVIKTDAETPEDRFALLLSLADAAVRGYELEPVGGRA